MHAPDRRVLLALTLLALGSRLVWALVVHPTWEFVFRDMNAFVTHAQRLVEHGFAPDRPQAFVAWGTHTLLAAPLALFGTDALVPAAVLWALLGAAAVPLTYLLACRVCSSPAVATAVGVAALLWYPNLAYSGLFLSETPMLCCLTAAVWRLVVLIQDGRGALGCGLLCALCFAIRPEVALAFALVLGLWASLGAATRARRRHVLIALLPGVLVLCFSLWHFHRHTGRLGVAESARANLTPARCHHPWVQTFNKPEELARRPGLTSGRVYGIVYFYDLRTRGDGWFGLHPAFGRQPAALEVDGPAGKVPVRVSEDGVSLQYVGHRADPDIHAAIQRACIATTGWFDQIFKISATNLAGLWFFNHQWPDNGRGGAPYLPWSDAFVVVFRWFVWLPSLLGVWLALAGARRNPGLAVCALPLIGLMIVAAVWFGEVRLRSPYDPLALLLAAEAYATVVRALRRRAAAHSRGPGSADMR